MATRNLVPRNSGEGSVGKIEKAWASGVFDNLYIDGTLVNDLSSNKSDGFSMNQNLNSGDSVTFHEGNFTNSLTINGTSITDLINSVEDAASGSANFLFFSDVIDNNGITELTYYDILESNTVLSGASVASASNLKVYVRWDGPHDTYIGSAFINGQQIPESNITELGQYTRRFEGYLDNLNLTGQNSITCTANGRTSVISLTELGLGPVPLNVAIDEIYNSTPKIGQDIGSTHLKEDDQINIFVDFENNDIDTIKVFDYGLSKGSNFQSYSLISHGDFYRATIPTTVSNRTGSQSVLVQAVNNFGSTGESRESTDFFNSSGTRDLDQLYPIISATDPTNYNGRTDGLRETEQVDVSNSISNWSNTSDTVLYTTLTNDIQIQNSGIFESAKTVSYQNGTFSNIDNLKIEAKRTNNGAKDIENVKIKIANSPQITNISIASSASSASSPNAIGSSEVKGGDTINAEIYIDTQGENPSDIKISISNYELSDGNQTTFVHYSNFSSQGNDIVKYTVPISVTSSTSRDGNAGIKATARLQVDSSNHITGDEKDSRVDFSSFATLNNTDSPQISFSSITYPSNQQALKNSEIATVIHTVSNFDDIVYSTSNNELNILNSSLYQPSKQVQRSGGTYNISSDNFIVTATKTSNGKVSSASTIVNIAHTALTFSINGLSSSLSSSPAGENYNFSLQSSQQLLQAPTLNTDVNQTNASTLISTSSGTSTNGNQFTLTVSDSDTKGLFSWLVSGENLAGIPTTSILTNPNYNIEGFSQRTVSISPNSLGAGLGDIGTQVSDPNNITAENLSEGGTANNGGTLYTYQSYPDGTQLSNSLDVNNKFTICDANGLTDSDGQFIFNLDKLNRSANTSTSNPAQFIISE